MEYDQKKYIFLIPRCSIRKMYFFVYSLNMRGKNKTQYQFNN